MRPWGSTLRKATLLNLSNITAIGQVRTYRTKGKLIHRVLTLDPTKLVQLKQSAIDISGLDTPTIGLPTGNALMEFMRVHHPDRRILVPFPDGTTGFFYYHSPADRPRISGQLRFRVTPSYDPASFSSGYDLSTVRTTRRLPKPWSVPLVKMVGAQRYHGLLLDLVSEGLIGESLVQCVRRLGSTGSFSRGGNFHFTLSDPFELNYALNPGKISFRAVTESGQGNFNFLSPHRNPQTRSTMKFESGIITVRFERSTLPEHEGRRVVVIRCLEIIEPLVIKPLKNQELMDPLDESTYTPVPGQSLQTLPIKWRTTESRSRPWGIDISDDSKHQAAPALRLLW